MLRDQQLQSMHGVMLTRVHAYLVQLALRFDAISHAQSSRSCPRRKRTLHVLCLFAGVSHGSQAPSPVLSNISPLQYGRPGNPGRPQMSIRCACTKHCQSYLCGMQQIAYTGRSCSEVQCSSRFVMLLSLRSLAIR